MNLLTPHSSGSSLRPQITRGDSSFGTWEVVTRAPHPQLSAFVLGYLGLKSRIDFTRERHLPSGEVELLMNLGSPYSVQHPAMASSWTTYRGAAVIGVHDTHVITEETGAQHVLVVRLRPAGAHILFDVPMHELANGFIELEEVNPEIARCLPSELYDTDWQTRFLIMDSIIARRMGRVRAKALRTAWAWERLREADGLLGIRSLANAAGCSQKHLIAQFHDYVGMPPKAVARIIRFNRAVKSIEREGPLDWVRLALDCGYYDQAHFVRDFKAFAGCTPTELSHSAVGPSFRADHTVVR